MAKTSVPFYYEYIEQLEDLDDKQFREIVLAMVEYDREDKIIELDKISKMAFNFIKKRIDYDKEKYELICERNKQNGSKGGRPKENPEKPKKPSGLSGNPEKPKKPDIDIELDLDIYNNNIVEQVIDYMNESAGTNFKSTTKKTQSLIKARLKEGFTIDDLKDVVYYKYHEWYKEPFMFSNGVSSDTYFRPNTLFSTNFEQYLQQYKNHFKEK